MGAGSGGGFEVLEEEGRTATRMRLALARPAITVEGGHGRLDRAGWEVGEMGREV